MLSRNLGEHLAGQAPTLGVGGAADPRTGLTPDEQRTLLHAIDVWWLYAGYAGLPRMPLAAVAFVLALGAGGRGSRRGARRARTPLEDARGDRALVERS